MHETTASLKKKGMAGVLQMRDNRAEILSGMTCGTCRSKRGRPAIYDHFYLDNLVALGITSHRYSTLINSKR